MTSRQSPVASRQPSAGDYARIATARRAASQVTRSVRVLASGVGRLATIGAALTLVAACADLRWQKEGATAAALERDLAECRGEARLGAGPDARLLGAGQPSMVGTNAIGRPLFATPGRLESDRFLVEHDLARLCMDRKGYALVPAAPEPPKP